MNEHTYLSTACFHGEHDYCKSMTGYRGAKRPAQCKFCSAPCVCECHRDGGARRGGRPPTPQPRSGRKPAPRGGHISGDRPYGAPPAVSDRPAVGAGK